MRRFIVVLTRINLAALLAAAGIGVASAHGGHGHRALHVYAGLFAGVLTAFTHCFFMFYLIGSGVHVKKLTQGSRELWDRFVPATRRLKAEGHPTAFLTMLFTIGSIITGGGVDTGVIHGFVHFLLFVAAIPLNAFVFAQQVRLAERNTILMSDVRRATAAVPPPAGRTS